MVNVAPDSAVTPPQRLTMPRPTTTSSARRAVSVCAPLETLWSVIAGESVTSAPMSDGPHENTMKPRSWEVTDGFERAPARAMLRAVGMTDDDWDKPQIGVASSWNEITPCNLPLDRLAKRAKEGIRSAGGFPFEFNTIAVSDGISMGHEGMRASLVSRRSSPTRSRRYTRRALRRLVPARCDKSLPGMLMAAARLNLPAVFSTADRSSRVSATAWRSTHQRVRAVGAARRHPHRERAGRDRDAGVSTEALRRHVHRQHHGVDRQALGIILPGSASSVDGSHLRPASGEAVIRLLELGLGPAKS
jgi:dihydroxy-acid dehydratase